MVSRSRLGPAPSGTQTGATRGCLDPARRGRAGTPRPRRRASGAGSAGRNALAEPAADPAPAPEQPDPAANPFASHSFEDEPEETEAERRSREARNRLARLRGYEEDEKSAAEAAASASRRDQLPDVDAINKTLEQTDDKPKRSKDYDYDPALFLKRERRAAGFRLGMTLIIVAGVLLTATYFLTPELTRALPMAQPYLDGYTAAVDLARLWVSDQAQELLVMVNDLTNGLISG